MTNLGKLGVFEEKLLLVTGVQDFVGRLVQEGSWNVCPGFFVIILSRISVTNRGKLGVFERNYSLDN